MKFKKYSDGGDRQIELERENYNHICTEYELDVLFSDTNCTKIKQIELSEVYI